MLILYTSDFHFNAHNSEFETAEGRLNDLASTINEQNYNIDIFIFTGDVIDAKSICFEAVKDMFESTDYDKYKKLVDCLNNNQNIKAALEPDDFKGYREIIIKKTNELFQKAGDVLNAFLSKIGVTDSRKIIFCCGNHDILRLENPPKFECKQGQNKEKLCASKYMDSYAPFLDFVKGKFHVDLGNSPKIYTIDDYSFLVIDSNIINEYGKSCIQCHDIESKLKQLNIKSKSKNIAISHKPFFDCCENAIINYSGENKKTVENLIKERCSFILFGDKHGQYVGKFAESEEMLFGSPLTSNDIHYCILKTDEVDGHLKEYRNVYFKNNKWHFSVSNIEIIIKFCEKYFSQFTKNYIGDINIRNITSIDFQIIETLFKNIARRRWLNEYEKDSLKTHSFSFQEIVDYLNRIYNDKKRNPNRLNLFNFRGRPSTQCH